MINKNGYNLIIFNGFLLLVLIILDMTYDSLILHILTGVFVVSLFFQFFFYRDPKRNIPIDKNIILSPADGRIIKISEVEENHFLHSKAILVSIFMSVFNVHVNRIPISGKIDFLEYIPGKFLPAFQDKSSELNEQLRIGVNSAYCRIFLVQIAGIIARRIVSDLKIGDNVKIGQRIGMIKYGSRLDIYIPLTSKFNVQLNDRVTAGETIIAFLEDND